MRQIEEREYERLKLIEREANAVVDECEKMPSPRLNVALWVMLQGLQHTLGRKPRPIPKIRDNRPSRELA